MGSGCGSVGRVVNLKVCGSNPVIGKFYLIKLEKEACKGPFKIKVILAVMPHQLFILHFFDHFLGTNCIVVTNTKKMPRIAY